MIRKPVVVHPGDTLRMVANLFVERHITSPPVVGSEDGGRCSGC
jgi:CBS domain-containing protein